MKIHSLPLISLFLILIAPKAFAGESMEIMSILITVISGGL